MDKDYSLIDIGANLTHDQLLSNIHSVIERFKKANIKKVIITSSNLTDTKKALDLIKKFPQIFFTTIGFHPHNAKDFKDEDLISMFDSSQEVYKWGIFERPLPKKLYRSKCVLLGEAAHTMVPFL